MEKKAIEMGFNWIFAIIAGGFILFIAIYATSRFVESSQSTLYTETAAKLTSLFDPLETGLASGKSSLMNFKKNTRIYFECDAERDPKPFGRQTVSFTEQTFGNKFGEKSGAVPVRDKYIFAENPVEGKQITMFSKPFFMPFKVSDILLFFSNDYCFYNTPEEIEEDMTGLNIKNIYLKNSSKQDCNGIKVCFGNAVGCDIKVSTSEKYVQKEGKKLYYHDSLVYGAIFASPEVYECNVKRLMSKFYELGAIYLDKIKIIERKECRSTLGGKLQIMMGEAKKLSSSKDLLKLSDSALEIDLINEETKSGCRLY